MKCEICGKQYVALGVHLRHKHQVDPDDYRDEHGILRTTPLVDEDLSNHLSACAKNRLHDDDYLSEMQSQCRTNAESKRGRTGPGMTRAGKAALAKRNTEANEKYLRSEKAQMVAELLRKNQTMFDVWKTLGVGPTAAKKMAFLEGVDYSPSDAKNERQKRAADTTRAKAAARVAAVMPHFYTSKSAAEMCRLSGISIKTYKNWLSAGLIPRHPNGGL